MLGISEGDFSSGLVTACELRPPAATYHHERASELRVPAPAMARTQTTVSTGCLSPLHHAKFETILCHVLSALGKYLYLAFESFFGSFVKDKFK
jgi:hypothetical protein